LVRVRPFKEKIVLEVVYQGKPIQKAVEEYDLPSTYKVQMWIRQFQEQLASGMIVLPPMTEQQKAELSLRTKNQRAGKSTGMVQTWSYSA
jgi:transposase-like protein